MLTWREARRMFPYSEWRIMLTPGIWISTTLRKNPDGLRTNVAFTLSRPRVNQPSSVRGRWAQWGSWLWIAMTSAAEMGGAEGNVSTSAGKE